MPRFWKTPWHSISHLGDYRILQSASAPLFSPFFSISHVDSDTKIGAQWSCIFRSPMPFSIPADHYLGKPKRSLKSCFLLTQFRMWRVLLSAIIIQGKIAWYTTLLGIPCLVPTRPGKQLSLWHRFSLKVEVFGLVCRRKCYSVIIVKWITKTKKNWWLPKWIMITRSRIIKWCCPLLTHPHVRVHLPLIIRFTLPIAWLKSYK